ncbi:hypothetical protein DQ04_03691020 [Trypanosoma grayi]|uniref:hypothetical protein n=1 Tax=Trypanosoma grayi TaxID=71804 RepID=UPI0004F479C6|nr:hypothetical protein DQ04_03691020 [Trypanosoma grayi]KEG10457.1 hypothetical protein DQ04_03691020 [Trypanosoma grayi]
MSGGYSGSFPHSCHTPVLYSEVSVNQSMDVATLTNLFWGACRMVREHCSGNAVLSSHSSTKRKEIVGAHLPQEIESHSKRRSHNKTEWRQSNFWHPTTHSIGGSALHSP